MVFSMQLGTSSLPLIVAFEVCQMVRKQWESLYTQVLL